MRAHSASERGGSIVVWNSHRSQFFTALLVTTAFTAPAIAQALGQATYVGLVGKQVSGGYLPITTP